MNEQFLNAKTEKIMGYILINQQEKTYFNVTDKSCIDMLDHLFILRIYNESELQEKLKGLREVKTLNQFDDYEDC